MTTSVLLVRAFAISPVVWRAVALGSGQYRNNILFHSAFPASAATKRRAKSKITGRQL